MTPNGRFYPGTHERVVLVVGEPGSVQMACDRIVTTIYTAADTSLDITQRVLIPDAASGLIIGHDGVRLGDLRQEAGVASIQVRSFLFCLFRAVFRLILIFVCFFRIFVRSNFFPAIFIYVFACIFSRFGILEFLYFSFLFPTGTFLHVCSNTCPLYVTRWSMHRCCVGVLMEVIPFFCCYRVQQGKPGEKMRRDISGWPCLQQASVCHVC